MPTAIYVCLTDLRVQYVNPGEPWSSSNTSLIGWIDMNTLMADPDADGEKKDAAAPAPS
jgi:hypothetical protein